MCWLQGVLDDQAEQAAALVPSAARPLDMPSSPGRPAAGTGSLGSSAGNSSQEQWPQQLPAGEQLNDWPILREGEGGKLVHHPLLTACHTLLLACACTAVQITVDFLCTFMQTSVNILLWGDTSMPENRMMMPGCSRLLCAAGASLASCPERARLLLR